MILLLVVLSMLVSLVGPTVCSTSTSCSLGSVFGTATACSIGTVCSNACAYSAATASSSATVRSTATACCTTVTGGAWILPKYKVSLLHVTNVRSR